MNTEKALARLTEVIRRKHLALATERSYCAWLRRYCDNLKGLPAHLSSEQKLERFLNALAQQNVAASTQNQAFNAIISKMEGEDRGAPKIATRASLDKAGEKWKNQQRNDWQRNFESLPKKISGACHEAFRG
jgi:hypothetical protein